MPPPAAYALQPVIFFSFEEKSFCMNLNLIYYMEACKWVMILPLRTK